MTPTNKADRALPSRLLSTSRHYIALAFHRFQQLHLSGKILVCLLLLFYLALGLFIVVVTPARIAQFLYDGAQKLNNLPFGWAIIGLVIVIISIPPMIGHTTMLHVCGFAYGLKGFPLAAAASVIGSSAVFLALRFLFGKKLRAWSSSNDKWQALETVINAKGLPLIILIRVSSFPPWVYSNTLFASIQTVSIWQFVAATVCIFPRFLLYVFIGSRMAALSDGNQRNKMDTQTKIINGFLIAGGLTISVIASWIVYTLMQRQLRQLSPELDERVEEALEDADEGAPLLQSLS